MPASDQAKLQTNRLELVPLGPEHKEHTMALDMDPAVMKHVAFGRPFTADEATQVHDWLLKVSDVKPGLGAWAGISDGEFVGWWMMGGVPLEDNPDAFEGDRTEYGFRVRPKFWGKGYAKEGAQELVRHAFEDLALKEVIGETMTVNQGSRKVMESCGLEHVETFFNNYDTPPPGIEAGEVRYSITQDAWQRKSASESSSGTASRRPSE